MTKTQIQGPNRETFDKDKEWFEILIELKTNLRVAYKDMDQFNGLL